jgi:hypothetical protein
MVVEAVGRLILFPCRISLPQLLKSLLLGDCEEVIYPRLRPEPAGGAFSHFLFNLMPRFYPEADVG